VGLLPEKTTSYPSRDFRFEPGDRVVFFTDGVVEAANALEEPWGYERLEALLSREAASPADRIIQRILDEVSAHVGATPLEDDRTLLVLTLDAA
jgi:sigma-B regulation protein RsbU (phosphoserine phosphatase)